MWSDGGVSGDESTESAELAGVAERVARAAGELVLAAHRQRLDGGGLAVDTKSTITDVVTAVDRDSELLIRARLADLRPGDPVLGEEQGADGEVEPGQVVWVVDPIDGTVNFVYGLPAFAVSVGAQVDGVSVAGAVFEPVSGRCWTAARGGGAWLDGRRLRVSSADRLELSLLATGFAYDRARRQRQAQLIGGVLGRVRDIRRAGSAALDLCAVAAGWVDASFEHGLSRWDWAAGAIIAAEAGATVIVPGEDPQLGDGTLAATPGIAAALRELLVEVGAADI
ncbi:MAG: inositol monophosphatase family protein [Thermocrispum sp.]